MGEEVENEVKGNARDDGYVVGYRTAFVMD